MSTCAPQVADPSAERLILEQAKAFAQELLRVANAAPDGQVLKLAELFVLDQGRKFLRFALTNALQTQAEAVEKRGHPRGPARADIAATTKATQPNSA